MDVNDNKKIDEAWKEVVEKEKTANQRPEEFIPPEADFNFFVTTLGLQASIFLGDSPNPITNKCESNLKQAQFIIDTLSMLKEKTKGNLTQEEEKLLEGLLYELRMRYIDKTNKGDEK